MVKTTGPMFSLDARGAIGDTLIFSKQKKSNYAKRYHNPANPRSDLQVSRRAMTKYLTQQWATLSTTHKNAFVDMAKTWNVSPYHAWLKFNSQRWTSFLPPAVEFPVISSFNTLYIASNYKKNERVYTLNARVNWVSEPDLCAIIQAKTVDDGLWDYSKVILILGNSVNAGPPNRKRLTGTWVAPNDSTWYFHCVFGSVQGGTSDVFEILP